MNKELFKEFLVICKQLNQIKIIPLLMGSLGLEYITNEKWHPSDIDIHVEGDPRGWDAPDEERIYQWDQILSIMSGLGYHLIDLHEHEFSKKDKSVEFGTINSLPEFANISLSELITVEQAGCTFKVPTVAQFLKIYQASAQDSYRNQNNNQKDFKKIDFLKQYQ